MPQNQALGYSNDHIRVRIITLGQARTTFEHSGRVVGHSEVETPVSAISTYGLPVTRQQPQSLAQMMTATSKKIDRFSSI